MYKKEEFMKKRKSIQVTSYALADVIEALTKSPEYFADIVVTKEDGHLIVMFNSTIEDCKCLNEGLLCKAIPKENKPDYYPIPMHGDPIPCDITTTSAGENNTNMTTRQSCETLY